MANISNKSKNLASKIKDKGARVSTDVAKASDLEYFWAWAMITHKLSESYPIPWEIILDFTVTHLEGDFPQDIERQLVESGIKRDYGRHKLKTVKRRVSTLSWKQKELGLEGDENSARHHEIAEILKMAAKDSSHAPKASAAVSKQTLIKLFSSIDDDVIGIRDKALFAVTWSSGRRRSESNGLFIENITTKEEAYYIFSLRNTKTRKSADETFKFKVTGLAKSYLDRWLTISEINEGPIFRRIYKNGRIGSTGISDTQFYRIVKKRCVEAGIDQVDSITPHSFRSGFVTELGKQNGNIGDGMALTDHRSLATFMSYYQAGQAESNTAANLFDDDD